MFKFVLYAQGLMEKRPKYYWQLSLKVQYIMFSFLLHSKTKRRACKRERDIILSTLSEAKQDVIELCPQVYKEF